MEFADGQQEIADGQQKFADGQQKIADGQQKNADGQQKIADDQKTLPTRLDRPLELQISQDMQLEDGWRVHDDDHKLNGWNVLGPDLPGEQLASDLTHTLQSERLCMLWVAPHATSQPSHPSDLIFFSDSVGPSLFSYITSHRITTGFSGGSSRRLCVVSLSLTLLLHTHTQSVSLVSHLFVGCSHSWFISIFHPSRRSHFVHTYHPSARSRVSL